MNLASLRALADGSCEMPAPDTNEIIAFWLMPAEPARKYFADLIQKFAAEFGAPVFAPHVTVFVCAPREIDAANALQKAFREMRALSLKVRGVNFSDGYTKTLFVEFQTSAELQNVSDRLREITRAEERYEVQPHVSLLYQTLPRATKEALATSLEIPWPEIFFDRAEVISTPVPIISRAEIERWKTLAGYSFASASRAE